LDNSPISLSITSSKAQTVTLKYIGPTGKDDSVTVKFIEHAKAEWNTTAIAANDTDADEDGIPSYADGLRGCPKNWFWHKN
jgi:hypothetical protein